MNLNNELAPPAESSGRNEEDILLLKRIGDRDELALTSLYDKYSKILYSLTMRILKSVDDAEGIIHDIFLEVWNKPNDYQSNKGSFFSWLMNMTRNRSLTRKRSRSMHKQSHMAELNSLSFHTETHHGGASSSSLIDEYRDSVLGAINKLNGEEQQVLILAYYEGYSQSEIGRIVNLPIDVIKFRIDDALRTISSQLQRRS
jgi:RNA polymerase sigma-70 factor (ECF subfamily)